MTPLNFDSTILKTRDWLKDVMDELGTNDEHRAYHATKAVLHALRDRLTIAEVFNLGEQFPLLLKGVYYENYQPANKPIKFNKEGFYTFVQSNLMDQRIENLPADQAVRAVLSMLQLRVSAGEMKDIQSILPKEFKELFDLLAQH